MKFTIYNLQFTIDLRKVLLFLILGLAFFLRVYRVSEYPAGLNADEAAIGYNAYSLIQTGKDEFGYPWPISFRSFNDFKPGLYFYLVLPFIKFLGLTEVAVRLPSVILGTASVLLIFLFARKMFKNDIFALVSACLLAISPWHLHFSRGGWESNAAVFFLILGVYIFFIALERPKYYLLSVVSFVLSMYTYHSARIIAPILLFGLGIFYRKEIFFKKNILNLSLIFVLSLFLCFPLARSLLGSGGISRFSGVGIFADKGPFWRVNELRGQHSNPYSIFPKIVHNQYFEYTVQFFDNYLRHFTGAFLFISGDEIQRNRVPETGQMYLVDIPFLILGFYFLIKKRPYGWNFILWWMIVAPGASALTFQSPHAIRALNMVIPLVIITACGLCEFIRWLNGLMAQWLNGFLIKLCLCIFVSLYLWNFSFYLHQYYVHYPKTYPSAWEYGFKDLVNYISEKQDRFDKIYVTNKYDQPYILFAFYLKYPPSVFQKEVILSPRDQYGFSTVKKFSKFYFDAIDWSNEKFRSGRTMVVGTSEEIPDSATIAKKVFFKDGKTEAFRIVEN